MAVELNNFLDNGKMTAELVPALERDASINNGDGLLINPDGRVYKAVWEKGNFKEFQRDTTSDPLSQYFLDFFSFILNKFFNVPYMSATYTTQFKELRSKLSLADTLIQPDPVVKRTCTLEVSCPIEGATVDEVNSALDTLERTATDEVAKICQISAASPDVVTGLKESTEKAIQKKITEESQKKSSFETLKKEIEQILEKFISDMISVKTNDQLKRVSEMEKRLEDMQTSLKNISNHSGGYVFQCNGTKLLANKADEKFGGAKLQLENEVNNLACQLRSLKQSISKNPCHKINIDQVDSKLKNQEQKIENFKSSSLAEMLTLSTQDWRINAIKKDIAQFFGDRELINESGTIGKSIYCSKDIHDQICYLSWLDRELANVEFLISTTDLQSIEEKIGRCKKNIGAPSAYKHPTIWSRLSGLFESSTLEKEYDASKANFTMLGTAQSVIINLNEKKVRANRPSVTGFESLVFAVFMYDPNALSYWEALTQKNADLGKKIDDLSNRIIGHQFITGYMPEGKIKEVFSQELFEIETDINSINEFKEQKKSALVASLYNSAPAIETRKKLEDFFGREDIAKIDLAKKPRLGELAKLSDSCSNPEKYAVLILSRGADLGFTIDMHINSIELSLEIGKYVVELEDKDHEYLARVNQTGDQKSIFDTLAQTRINSLKKLEQILDDDKSVIDELELRSIEQRYGEHKREINEFVANLEPKLESQADDLEAFVKTDSTYIEFTNAEFKRKAALTRQILEETKRDLEEVLELIGTLRKEDLENLDLKTFSLEDHSGRFAKVSERLKKNQRLLDQLGFDVDKLWEFFEDLFGPMIAKLMEPLKNLFSWLFGAAPEENNPKPKLRELLVKLNVVKSKTVSQQ